MVFKAAPLSSTFFLIGIIGFLISSFYVAPVLSLTWGIAFSIVFMCMILASFVSMTRATPDAELFPTPLKKR